MHLNQAFVASIVPDAQFYGASLECEQFWRVDSRQVEPGDVFVALPGTQVDGHQFVGAAYSRGARACMIAQEKFAQLHAELHPWLLQRTLIVVANPAAALLTLAARWRVQFTYPVIGVTGSVGKTTTKELIARMLDRSGARVLTSLGNQNSRIGLALNLLRMRSWHTHAVLEMGISHRDEMAQLAQLVRPTTAVITAIGHSHMEGLGSLVDIAAQKREIFCTLPEHGIGIINGDQPLLSGVAYTCPMLKFGYKTSNQIQARKVRHTGEGTEFILKVYGERHVVQLPSRQLSRVTNALAAVSAAQSMGVSLEHCIAVLQQPFDVPGRFERRQWGAQHTLIDDSYNANPESMKAALLAFESLETPDSKIVVLGDMLELGTHAPFWHRQIVRFLRKAPSVAHVILVGKEMEAAHKVLAHTTSFELCRDWQAATETVRDLLARGTCCVLVKASHGIGLHQLVAVLAQELNS